MQQDSLIRHGSNFKDAVPAIVVYKCWRGTHRERKQVVKKMRNKEKHRLQQQLLVELVDCPCSQVQS
jgi:hypothetical protein